MTRSEIGDSYSRFSVLDGRIYTDGLNFYYANERYNSRDTDAVEVEPGLFGLKLPEYAARVIRRNLENKFSRFKTVA